jgi:hypothetical protein
MTEVFRPLAALSTPNATDPFSFYDPAQRTTTEGRSIPGSFIEAGTVCRELANCKQSPNQLIKRVVVPGFIGFPDCLQ